MKNKLLLIVLVVIAPMCKSYESLILTKEDLKSTQLKLNGYYYTFIDKKYNVFFLYKNGIYHGGNWLNDINFDVDNLSNLDKEVIKIFSLEKEYPTQYHWGVVKIEGSALRIERWLSGSGGTYPTQMLIGEIINDNTIHFSQKIGDYPTKFGKNKKTVEISETYHFRQFSPKPDSTNNFIK